MVAKVVTAAEHLLEKFQILTLERQQQLIDFAEFLAQQQQLCDVESLSGNRAADSQAENWVDQISGSFKDDPEFEEILRYGREFRQGDYQDSENQQNNE